MKAEGKERPQVFEKVGNLALRYRFNIRKEERSTENGTEIVFVWDEVQVYNPVTSNKITEAVLNEMWSPNYEQKLINEYNSAQMELYSEEEAEKRTAAYQDFLRQRAELKERIDKDCTEAGIK